MASESEIHPAKLVKEQKVISIFDGLHDKKRRELIDRVNKSRAELREVKRAVMQVRILQSTGRAAAANRLLTDIINYSNRVESNDN